MATKTGGSKGKYGRNQRYCDAYKTLGIRMMNKRKKVWRQWKRSEFKDMQARNWLHAAREL